MDGTPRGVIRTFYVFVAAPNGCRTSGNIRRPAIITGVTTDEAAAGVIGVGMVGTMTGTLTTGNLILPASIAALTTPITRLPYFRDHS